jgi:hypothetical protein
VPLPDSLVDEISSSCDDVRSLGSQLHQAKHDAGHPTRTGTQNSRHRRH